MPPLVALKRCRQTPTPRKVVAKPYPGELVSGNGPRCGRTMGTSHDERTNARDPPIPATTPQHGLDGGYGLHMNAQTAAVA